MQVFLHPTLYTEGNGLGSLRYIKSKAFNNAFLLSCGYLFGSVGKCRAHECLARMFGALR